MSKKAQREKDLVSTNDGSPPGTAVDFLFRTMIEREGAPGKRRIRPKNVDELLQADIQELGSDEDPDFDVSFDKLHNESDVSIGSDEEEDSSNAAEASEDGDKNERKVGDLLDDSDDEDDDYDANLDDDRTSGDDTSEEEDDNDSSTDESEEDTQSPVQKKSALRDTLQKLNEADNSFTPQRNRKRKRPKKATVSGTNSGNPSKGKSSVGAGSKKEDSKSTPGKSSSSVKKTARKGSSTSKKKKMISTKSTNRDARVRKKKKRKLDGPSARTISDVCFSMERSQKENRKEINLGNPICSACLGNKSDGMNEIVECDSCGITVHEGCYGVSDTLSVSSGGSSCSTEPWFCDACKAGAKAISCELCPMKGGLFKETTGGRWVHLVCSLYTPGVAIGDNGLPNLFGIPYAKWGAHPCSVCEDIRYTRTGVCIPCDAGMCKTYLHATCAQKHGLLSDPIMQEGIETGAEADPFYAACKLHTNRETAKRRAKSYSILQEQLRIKVEQKASQNLTPLELNNATRIKRKLERIRFKVAIKQAHNFTPYALALSSNNSKPFSHNSSNFATQTLELQGHPILPKSWLEGQKKSRLLSTSAGSASSFIHKATLMGLDIPSLELEDKNTRIVASVKKKWNVLPSMSVEFSAYYQDRELRITSLNEQCEQLEKDNDLLSEKQYYVHCNYDCSLVNNEEMGEENDRIRDNLCGLGDVLKGFITLGSNRKLVTKLNSIVGSLASTSSVSSLVQGNAADTSLSPSGGGGGLSRRRSLSQRASPPKSTGKNKYGKKLAGGNGNKSPTHGRLAIASCALCNKCEDQHMITRCDHCKKHYHLKCLDPPLTKQPKRSRLCGWMCSDCGEEEPEEEDQQVDTEAPRTLRGRTKLRKPGKYRFSTDSVEGNKNKMEIGSSPERDQDQNEIIKEESSPQPTLSIPLTNGDINVSKPKAKSKKRRTQSGSASSKRRKSSNSGVGGASSSAIVNNFSLSSPFPAFPTSITPVFKTSPGDKPRANVFEFETPKSESISFGGSYFTTPSESPEKSFNSSLNPNVANSSDATGMVASKAKPKRSRKPKEPALGEPPKKKLTKVKKDLKDVAAGILMGKEKKNIGAGGSMTLDSSGEYKFTDSSPDKVEIKTYTPAKKRAPSKSKKSSTLVAAAPVGDEIKSQNETPKTIKKTPKRPKKKSSEQSQTTTTTFGGEINLGNIPEKMNSQTFSTSPEIKIKKVRTSKPRPKKVKSQLESPSKMSFNLTMTSSDLSLNASGIGTPGQNNSLEVSTTKKPKKPRKKKEIVKTETSGTEIGSSVITMNGPGIVAKKAKKKSLATARKKTGGGIQKLDLNKEITDGITTITPTPRNGSNPDIVALAVSNLTGAMNGGLKKRRKQKKNKLEGTGENDAQDKNKKSALIPSSQPQPKRRKKISPPITTTPVIGGGGSSSTQPLSNQAMAIIDAVAKGSFEEGINGLLSDPGSAFKVPTTGSSCSSTGIIMQGVAPNQPQWHDNIVGDEDHSIMKGHAMGSNNINDEVVTMNLLELINCTESSVSSGETLTYTPGFYSSAPIMPASPGLLSSSTCTPPAVSSSIGIVGTQTSSIGGGGGSGGGSGPSWGQPPPNPKPQQESQQNVIKLHYESASIPNPLAPVNTPASLVSTLVPNYIHSSPPPPANTSLSSAYNGRCSTCNKDDYKKYMITCDKCIKDFHFMCLNPPLKYSPRRRGYSWYCEKCDDEETSAWPAAPVRDP